MNLGTQNCCPSARISDEPEWQLMPSFFGVIHDLMWASGRLSLKQSLNNPQRQGA
jgi:hypothetical protein